MGDFFVNGLLLGLCVEVLFVVLVLLVMYGVDWNGLCVVMFIVMFVLIVCIVLLMCLVVLSMVWKYKCLLFVFDDNVCVLIYGWFCGIVFGVVFGIMVVMMFF